MMQSELVREWAVAIRSLDSLESAAKLLAEFGEAWLEEPHELLAVEQLPDWLYGTLLSWQLERQPPPGVEGEHLLALRSWQLCGALANACEQAARLGEANTASRMALLLNFAVQRARGCAGLEAAFRRPEAERAPQGET